MGWNLYRCNVRRSHHLAGHLIFSPFYLKISPLFFALCAKTNQTHAVINCSLTARYSLFPSESLFGIRLARNKIEEFRLFEISDSSFPIHTLDRTEIGMMIDASIAALNWSVCSS